MAVMRALMRLAAGACLLLALGSQGARTSRAPAASALKRERARAAAQVAQAALRFTGLSTLENAAILPSTAKNYQMALEAFAAFCSARRRDWDSMMELDSVLVEYFDQMYLLGENGNTGSQLLAALSHVMPSLYKAVPRVLPRAKRCAISWARRAPAHTRLPLPRSACFAIAGLLASWGQARMAICVVASFLCYLRPGEALRLRGRSLVQPAAAAGLAYDKWALLLHDVVDRVPSKVGLFEESVIIDNAGWLFPVLEALKVATAAEASLWDFDLSEYKKAFAEAAKHLSLSRLRPHLYSLRHGGASEDIIRGLRTPEQVQRRGRWGHSSSMKRYAKESKLLAELHWVPAATLSFGKLVEANFRSVIEGALAGGPHPLRAQVPAALAGLVGAGPSQAAAAAGRGRKRRHR